MKVPVRLVSASSLPGCARRPFLAVRVAAGRRADGGAVAPLAPPVRASAWQVRAPPYDVI